MNELSPYATVDFNAPVVLADHEFTAEVRPLYNERGFQIASDIARGVYRDDTGECIATCGKSFKPVQHYDIMQPIFAHLESAGYDLEMRKPGRRDLYDLKGKKGAFVTPTFAHNGAVMRTDIILGDFITPTGRTSYLDQGEDTMLFKISLLNSHNGSLAVRANMSYERLICMNGMTKPSFSAGVYGKHTQGFSIATMSAQIEAAIDSMSEDADKFGAWATTKIGAETAEKMLIRTLAKQSNDARGKPQHSERLVTTILNRFLHEDQTVWGLYNAITWWQTHAKMNESSTPLTTRLNRESRVARMLRTNEWKALTDA
jgi:hypothetical protein